MAENEGARKTGKAYVMCTTPDVCLTRGSPVPYSIISYLDCAEEEVETVKMTGMCALNMGSYLTTVIGDEAGSDGGVSSGVNLGYCVPITYCPTVKANGKNLLYHSSEFWMNCPAPGEEGNTKGKLQFITSDTLVGVDETGSIVGDTNPPIKPETQAEEKLGPHLSSGATDHYSVAVKGGLTGGRDPKTGVTARVVDGSLEVGLQNTADIELAGVGWSNEDGTKNVHLDTIAGNAHAGFFNDDGSVGVNVGASFTIIGVEGTFVHDGWGGTLGVAAGFGPEFHAGVHDSDGDGAGELSIKVGLKIVTLGINVEWPF